MGTVVPFGKRRAPNRSWNADLASEVLTLAVRAGSVVVEAADVETGLTAEQARRLARNLIDRWPEVVCVARAFARACGLPETRLGKYERDSGVRALVELYATGFTQTELEHVAALVPRQPWWSQSGKRLGLSSLTIEVVRRNLPGVGPPRPVSPQVAKVLAEVQRKREAG